MGYWDDAAVVCGGRGGDVGVRGREQAGLEWIHSLALISKVKKNIQKKERTLKGSRRAGLEPSSLLWCCCRRFDTSWWLGTCRGDGGGRFRGRTLLLLLLVEVGSSCCSCCQF
jgi:hypothetical protein